MLTSNRGREGLCKGCLSPEHRQCATVRFNQAKGSCCYTCGLPQRLYGEYIHGDMDTGACIGGLYYVTRCICWYIYRDDELNWEYIEENITTEDEFREWLRKPDDTREMLNASRLTLSIWKARQ